MVKKFKEIELIVGAPGRERVIQRGSIVCVVLLLPYFVRK